MKYDGSLNIAHGMSVNSKVWKNKKQTWSKIVDRLCEEYRTKETYNEFSESSKAEKLKIKDVGGYVGGYLRAGRRKPENVVSRQLITLDLDFARMDIWDEITMQFENAAVIHSTHAHTEEKPRFRLIMPLSREVTPDEYVAISRQIAGIIGVDLFDETGFETNRLMFWPSTSKDGDFVFEKQDGPWLDADEVLSFYTDWTDSSLWPTSRKEAEKVKSFAQKQEDPETKRGIIGAFCRTFPITEVIDNFLQDVYKPSTQGRYTYINGTAASGLVIYEDKFAYSHHGTDPCSGKLCNAFDLVRIHKFGHEDSGTSTAKSMRLMQDFARNDDRVKNTVASENMQEAKYDFSEESDAIEKEENFEWMKDLEIDAKSKYLSTANNLNIIFANDTRLKGLFKQNNFDSKRYIIANVPWRKIKFPEPVKNVDYSGVRNYIETIYGISGNLKIDDSLALEFERNSFHPIKEYLGSLTWDGTKRVDSLLIDYFGVKDTPFYKEAIRKTLVAAVARVYRPGVKFDLVLTLVGKQGTGKSTFVKKLGREWFSDTFMTVKGKEALEQIQGAWFIEMAELAGLRKAEVEAVKHFISKQEDIFRPAYARTSEVYPRQCVFIGTTNKKDFLNDPTGNRRFLPIDINPEKATKSIFDIPDQEINQIWAETVLYYKAGEKLFLSPEAELVANEEQKKHSETDERIGLIEKYLDVELPEDWGELDLFDRRSFLDDPLSKNGSERREYFCVAEIWCECLRKEKQDMDRYKTREINETLRNLEDWEQSNSTKNFKLYGKQKYYSRKK